MPAQTSTLAGTFRRVVPACRHGHEDIFPLRYELLPAVDKPWDNECAVCTNGGQRTNRTRNAQHSRRSSARSALRTHSGRTALTTTNAQLSTELTGPTTTMNLYLGKTLKSSVCTQPRRGARIRKPARNPPTPRTQRAFCSGTPHAHWHRVTSRPHATRCPRMSRRSHQARPAPDRRATTQHEVPCRT